MTSSYLDRYGRAQTICHRLPALVKLILALSVVIAGVCLPARLWPAQGVLISLVFIAQSLARIPLAYIFRRLAFFLPLVVAISISVPLSQGFRAGWDMTAAILFRSTLAFLALLWLVNVMPFDQMLATLRRLRVPEILIAMLAFMYRYLFVLWDEMDRMRMARRARSFGKERIWRRWKTSAQVIGMLLIRAIERAERVHGAMCARGWDGRVRFLDDRERE
jgi:cobalt/nickel transport system permease protein